MIQPSELIFNAEENLLKFLIENSELMDFHLATLAFKEIKRTSQGMEFHNFFGLIGGYKPVYFLLK